MPAIDEAHDHTGEVVVASGWGQVSDSKSWKSLADYVAIVLIILPLSFVIANSNLSPVLRKVNATVLPISECELVYGASVIDGARQICLSGQGGKSTCTVSHTCVSHKEQNISKLFNKRFREMTAAL